VAQREEESLIEDMRATIKADRERAAARVAKQPPTAPPAAATPPERAIEPEKSRLRRLLGR
jgi:hypothetical protein